MKNLTLFCNTKKYLKLLMFLCLFFTISNCRSNDDDPIPPKVYPNENPLAAYITNSGFTATGNFINSGDYEFGLVFSPNVNGKITAITAQLPDINAALRVTIWDFDTQTVLKTEVVNVSAANTLITKSVTELALVKDKKYAITMNSNDWYNRTKPAAGVTTYPITAGNIKFTDYLWKSGTAQAFPTNSDASYYAGDASFVFQQTD